MKKVPKSWWKSPPNGMASKCAVGAPHTLTRDLPAMATLSPQGGSHMAWFALARDALGLTANPNFTPETFWALLVGAVTAFLGQWLLKTKSRPSEPTQNPQDKGIQEPGSTAKRKSRQPRQNSQRKGVQEPGPAAKKKPGQPQQNSQRKDSTAKKKPGQPQQTSRRNAVQEPNSTKKKKPGREPKPRK